ALLHAGTYIAIKDLIPKLFLHWPYIVHAADLDVVSLHARRHGRPDIDVCSGHYFPHDIGNLSPGHHPIHSARRVEHPRMQSYRTKSCLHRTCHRGPPLSSESDDCSRVARIVSWLARQSS